MSARTKGICIGFALALTAGSLGCTGSAGTKRGGPDDPENEAGSTGNAGSGGKGGSTAMGGMGGSGPGPAVPGGPGRVTIRRLNRVEYDNTIRDLIGLDLKPSKTFEFVEDEFGDGFNNDADVLTAPPITIEKYLTSAQSVIDKALDPANAAARARIMVCTVPMVAEATCGPRIISEFARRAFRRPVTTEELAPYVGLIDVAKKNGDTFEIGLKLALSGILMSPDFLFRAEIDPARGVTRAVNDHELASRLSYFIWASMPDDALFKAATDKVLTKPEEIARQVARMLADPKAAAFTSTMVEQWMHTSELANAEPAKTSFPMWQAPLRGAMEQEVRAFLGPILGGQAPAEELLTAKYVYANRALGMFYGLPGAASLPVDTFQKVMLTDTRRGGVLRQGSLLVGTSHPDVHSPTRRGKWILDRLLCSSPPPPPGNIPAFMPDKIPEGTLRQKLEKTHVALGAACMGCHAFIDPVGFALENYDGVGLWRDKDNNLPVDATGEIPGSGVKFKDAAEMSDAISKDERFPACVAKHILTYALGRKMTPNDNKSLDDLGQRFAAGGLKMPHLIELVSQSPLMTQRTAEKE
jgi:hypothetical protein